ncbi:D-sedoheptulose-7-phosphate isomerase [Candidatus Viridilinea mediisalina]|uniref:Phosphoheptose isomerase n=1 Tax=Candidatus Viridilinea mediisalina TaxID=2024553 RepID=A0A2A6RDQ0_9CHLR|nr:SIS domain-containing protein [Candidatus Viridilinea mediisalina]PDV99624.1 phosphoheptose isomerase [Candidatus Viridilinea mediisalina]
MASFRAQAHELQAVLTAFVAQSEAVDTIAGLVSEALLAGHTLFTCGNGGSAADAMHLAEELVGRYRSNRRPLAAYCLNADGGALTCIANDFGYDQVFARPLTALGRPGDLLVVFSTSGNSPNIIEALRVARSRGMLSLALLGNDGGQALPLADHALVVPSAASARIQEVHGLILHAICEELEERVAG